MYNKSVLAAQRDARLDSIVLLCSSIGRWDMIPVTTAVAVPDNVGLLWTVEPCDDEFLERYDALRRGLPDAERVVPHWDATQRELAVDGQVVKQYHVPARNQERVLAAFQEEGWPDRIDDPLPGRPDHDPKRRLNDTIKKLNGHRLARMSPLPKCSTMN
jgi:hypothetical protein